MTVAKLEDIIDATFGVPETPRTSRRRARFGVVIPRTRVKWLWNRGRRRLALAGMVAAGAAGVGTVVPGPPSPAQVFVASEPEPAALVPGLVSTPSGAYEWQHAAVGENRVAPAILRSARAVTIAIVDTGADLSSPVIRGKVSSTVNIVDPAAGVTDIDGHGTFVASLAGGSPAGGGALAGFGGDARLMIVQAGIDNALNDADIARGIVYAVDHGAQIVNLSIAAPAPSKVEQRAISYAIRRNVLVVAAAGNDYENGNQVQYPAAYLQSRPGNGGGLVVAASDENGMRASFSNVGDDVSLAAPGENVLGALSTSSSPFAFPRIRVPGAARGLYGFSSGTSFSSAEVAGFAALVWAANPSLRARDVARILEQTAAGHGAWNPQLGYGVIDVAAAVEAASTSPSAPTRVAPAVRGHAFLA